ncbi:MAG: hypothetical protein QM662_18020 [Gordonia sp. (in: high G+C Gram-positive bacteria)]
MQASRRGVGGQGVCIGSEPNRTDLRGKRITAVIPVKDDQAAHRKAKGSRGVRPPNFDTEVYKRQRLAVLLENPPVAVLDRPDGTLNIQPLSLPLLRPAYHATIGVIVTRQSTTVMTLILDRRCDGSRFLSEGPRIIETISEMRLSGIIAGGGEESDDHSEILRMGERRPVGSHRR